MFVASAGRIHKTNMFPTVFQLCHTGAHTPVLNLCLSTAHSITVRLSSKPLLVTSPTLSCESWRPQSFDGSASELHPDGSKLHSASHVSRGNPAKEVKVSSHQYIQTCHQQHGSHNPGETGYSILEFAKGTGLRPTTKV